MKKITILLSLLLISFCNSFAQKPCSGGVYRQFDFWIGEWEVFNTNGKKAGESRVELILDSCVVLENWTSETVVKGLRFSGKSYNSFNAAKNRWQQYWVDNTGTVAEYFNGKYSDNIMVLKTDSVKQADGSFKIQRMSFYSLSADKVRQHGESSIDAGKTWKTDFDLEYRRRK